jgi:lipooligosaccharide transport system permease protein
MSTAAAPGVASGGPAEAGNTAGAPRVGGPWAMALREFGAWLLNYKRTWRGSIYSSILSPVLYLGAMGLGLGSLVDKHGTASLGGVSYLAFIAPGLLAANAMQTAMMESTYPVLGSVKWFKTYYAASATPLEPGDVFRGHLLFTTLRLTMNGVIYLVVMAAFGAVESAWAIIALPVSVLTGLAFAAPLEAYAITRKTEVGFSALFRFGMIPLFLFSGTFFPITQLPDWIRPLAYVTPLWHGVALCRALSLGTADLPAAVGHIAYLGVLAAAGIVAGNRTYRRRLHV